jgi:hypothetical protein
MCSMTSASMGEPGELHGPWAGADQGGLPRSVRNITSPLGSPRRRGPDYEEVPPQRAPVAAGLDQDD